MPHFLLLSPGFRCDGSDPPIDLVRRADHISRRTTSSPRSTVVGPVAGERRLGHDRPRLRIRSNGLLQAVQIHWEVITVGPTSPTRSTSSEPHHGQLTRSLAWGPAGVAGGSISPMAAEVPPLVRVAAGRRPPGA